MTLYDTDFVAWTQHQTTLLRSMPGTHSLDMEHLIDEIEGLSRSAVADLSLAIRQLLSGLIRRSVDAVSVSIENILAAQSEVVIRANAGVWKHVDLDGIWKVAKRSADVDLPERCPTRLEQLISDDFDFEEAVTALKL